MKKIKLISSILTAALALQLLTVGTAAKLVTGITGEPKDTGYVQPLSIPTNLPAGNRLPYSSCDTDKCLMNWEVYRPINNPAMRLEWRYDDNGGYLRATDRGVAYFGFSLRSLVTYSAGLYKFTGYFRTYYEDEVTQLRVEFLDDYGEQIGPSVYVNCGNDWEKVEYYLEVPDTMKKIRVCGGPYAQYIQDFCMDEFSMVKVDEIPAGYEGRTSYGLPTIDHDAVLKDTLKKSGISDWTEESAEQFELNGIMLNHDCDSLMHSIGGLEDMTTVTPQDIIDLAMQYEGTQVTDFMINVNSELATYPSKIWTSYLDKYYQKEENGIAVDYSTGFNQVTGAQYLWETLHLDYIGLWCEIFPEIGINPWLSFRMNDAHERNYETSVIQSNFFHENPHLYRVKHHNYVSYMDKVYDYTHPETREHFLQLINESLSHYDCYGIELDYQREAFLWYIGGEYEGLDILNQFMRDVYDIVAIYEEKYGHDIKIAVRVPSDPMTCYELGLDVFTWAAEGTIDHVTAGGRFETTDTDVPIRLWDSVLEPLGVTLAANVDVAYLRHELSASATGGMTLDMWAGFAANAYSQGADKIYVFNNNTVVDSDGPMTEDDKTLSITRDGNYSSYRNLFGNTGMWILYNTIGSYEKVIQMNRVFIPTFNDTKAPWVPQYRNELIPYTFSEGVNHTFRMPMGDITKGSTVTLMIAYPSSTSSIDLSNPPTVFVNSQPCEFVGVGDSVTTRTGTLYTSNKVMLYEIPVEAQGQTYAVVEVTSPFGFTADHMAIDIEAPAQ